MIRVLLVEDDDANRLTMAALLEDEGFAVDEAASFAEAKLKIATAGAPYDVILLDRNLGDGFGPDLAPDARARMPRVRLVALSGHDAVTEGWEDARVVKGADPASVKLAIGHVPGPEARP